MNSPSHMRSRIAATNTYSGQDWHRFIANIQQGDEKALARLYKASARRVYGLALSITGNPANAEEVVVDVYLHVWRAASTFDAGRGHPLTWLMVLTRSRAISKWRSSRSLIDLERTDELLEDFPCVEEDGPEHICLHSERSRHLAKAMKSLSAKENQVLSLAFLFSLSHLEIASHMQMPVGTVKSCIRRAMAKIRENFGDLQE